VEWDWNLEKLKKIHRNGTQSPAMEPESAGMELDSAGMSGKNIYLFIYKL